MEIESQNVEEPQQLVNDDLDLIDLEVINIQSKPPAETKKSIFAGDLICFRANKEFEWKVWYGKVLSNQNPLVMALNKMSDKVTVGATYINEESEKSEMLELGPLNDPFYIQWTHSNRLGNLNANEIGLVDRIFNTGDRVVNNGGIRGTVTNTSVKVAVELQVNANFVIENIPAESLNPISPIVRGREIMYRGWIGVITSITRSITSQFEGGPLFDMLCIESDGFMKPDPYWGMSTVYPGFQTTIPEASLRRIKFRSKFLNFWKRWLPPVRSYYAHMPCTTLSIEPISIEVNWIQPCLTSLEPKGSQYGVPDRVLKQESIKDIKLLGLPSYQTIGLNSVRMYKVQPSDKVISYATWFNLFQTRIHGPHIPPYNKFYPSQQQTARWNIPKGFETPVKVIAKETFAEVEWDNGDIEKVKCTDISPISIEAAEIEHGIANGLVVERVAEEERQEYGIIQPSESVASTKLVNVRWILPIGDTGQDFGIKTESIYDIKPHRKLTLYQKGTLLFIQGGISQTSFRVVGTVIDLDVCHGKIILAVPGSKNTVSEWPHSVTPMTTKSIWDFFTRKWIVEEMLPPLHQIAIENVSDISEKEAIPVNLIVNNNNSSSPIVSGSIWDEPIFEVLDCTPEVHRYYKFEPKDQSDTFLQQLRSEIVKMKDNLPEGIWVRAYENRLDLYSVVILGPEKTPYEDGVYFFDIQIPNNFPAVPPKIHHVSYTNETISPFIAVDGTFCVSKFNWKFNEEIGKPASYIANALGQLQEIIFTAEPYYQIYGKETKIGTLEGKEGSRTYNEKIFLDVLTSYSNMAKRPYEPWRRLITQHLSTLMGKINALSDLLKDKDGDNVDLKTLHGLLIFPTSEGFKITLAGRLEKLRKFAAVSCGQIPVEVKTVKNESDTTNENTVALSKAETEEKLSEINELNENENRNVLGQNEDKTG